MNQQLALVIEDDRTLRRAYRRVLTDLGYEVEESETIAGARLSIRNLAPSLILVDIELPDGNGLDLMNELRSSTQGRFIVVSGNTSQRAAIKSIRHRAVEFVSKPVSLQDLKRIIDQTVAPKSIHNADTPAVQVVSDLTLSTNTPDCWINHGSSSPLVDLRMAISFSAELRKGHTLIVGEPGVEKLAVAATVHHRARRQGSIVIVNCEELHGNALVDKLYGSVSGDNCDGGSIARAAGGTLVLHNVDSLPHDLQSALSMFLDTGVFRRPGSDASSKAVVAVIGIVSDQGRTEELRKGFLARLSQVTLRIPSLRDCAHDIPGIANWLLTQSIGYQHHYAFSDAMMSQLLVKSWTRNICELRETIQASVNAMAESTESVSLLQLSPGHQHSTWNPFDDLVGMTLRDFSDQLISSTLSYCQGNKARTAQTLDISLKTLYNRLDKL